MARLVVFNQVSLDGYFVDAQGRMDWAHKHDPEWNAFVSDNAAGDAVLVFGRRTYEMMAGFWPTPMALESNPVVARRMNDVSKVVFSRTLDRATWKNTTLVKDDMIGAVRTMKAAGPDMVILGSGTIVSQLTEARLVDGYQVVVNPIVLGTGRTMFDGVTTRPALALTKTRAFGNGNVVLWYDARP